MSTPTAPRIGDIYKSRQAHDLWMVTGLHAHRWYNGDDNTIQLTHMSTGNKHTVFKHILNEWYQKITN